MNSISGLAGLYLNNTLELPWKETLLLIVMVFLGGQLGIRMSLKKLTPNGIKRVTAVLVLAVGIRVVLKNGFELL